MGVLHFVLLEQRVRAFGATGASGSGGYLTGSLMNNGILLFGGLISGSPSFVNHQSIHHHHAAVFSSDLSDLVICQRLYTLDMKAITL